MSEDVSTSAGHSSGRTTESVWDYPRPPALDDLGEHVTVAFGGTVIADTRRALRVMETTHPPVYYLPRRDIVASALAEVPGSSWCEFKGRARYLDIVGDDGRVATRAGWYYPEPTAGYERLVDHVAIYPGRMDCCKVDGEVVRAQEGDFYGGWITARITGPFKGGPGTTGW
jgi:uncharacterized protein (DUF427 family)